MKKRVLAIALVAMMVLSTACSSKKDDSNKQKETTPTATLTPTQAPNEEPEDTTIKRVLPKKTPVDLIDTQGYEQVGDLSVRQNGFGADKDGLYTIGSPSWNDANASVTQGEPPVVAIIDSGIDYNHPDFKDKIVDMTKYSSLGGRYGYNCSGDGPEDDPMDDDGHGTHCAGIIAAAWDGTGTSGLASNVQLCIVRASVDGEFNDNDTLRAFNYLIDAVDNGLNLCAVNCSFGGDGFTHAQRQAVDELGKRGVVVAFASGNSTFDNDEYSNNAADTSLSPYSIIVNSANFSGYPSDFTQYGQTMTDVFAPGDAILSVVSKQSSAYLAMVDKNRVTYDDFTENQPDKKKVRIFKYGVANVKEQAMLEFEDAEAFAAWIDSHSDAGARVSTTDSFDGDGWVYELDVPALSEDERAVYVVAIPVDEDQVEAASFISAGLKSSLNRCRVWLRPIYFSYANEEEGGPVIANIDSNDGWRRAGKVWINKSEERYDADDLGISPYIYYKGCIYYAINIEDFDKTETESKLYVDSLGMGYSLLRYDYFQGTSMATPMVTGATAVMYSHLLAAGELDGLTPAERAIYVANTVKASVRQYEGLKSLCSSQGAFSFEVKKEDYVPVINSVKQDGTAVTLVGQYFGASAGEAVLNGLTCKVSSWSDREVVLELPAEIENGRYLLEVTAANGRETLRKIVVSGLKGKKLFDVRVELPDELKNAYIRTMTSIDGVLYVVPQTLTGGHVSTLEEKQLWTYDPVKNEWKRCADIPIPESVTSVSCDQKAMIGNYNGYIIASVVYRSKPQETFMVGELKMTNTDEFTNLIYFYNPKKDQWIKADIKDKLNGSGIVFGTEYGVFYCGGFDIISVEDTMTLESGEEIEYSYTDKEPSCAIFKLEFDMKALENATDSIEVTVVEAGESEKGYLDEASVTSYENLVFLSDRSYEWLEWSEKDQKFHSYKQDVLPGEMAVVGDVGSTICYAAEFAGAITPIGTLFTALSGAAHLGRDYDTFFYNPDDEKVIPYEKMASYTDLYAPRASYSNGYYYVWGDSHYNGDGTLGYLTYMKIAE